jgi:hypothetical protein
MTDQFWMNGLEAAVGSFGMLLSGLITIPLAARTVGVKINLKQAFGMSLIFFVLRVIWLWIVRGFFS